MYRTYKRLTITAVVIAVLLGIAGLSSGCLWAPHLADLRKEIQRQLPGVSFEKEVELTLGPVSLALARMVTRMVPDARDASGYLRDVSRIELAVYNAESMPSSFNLAMPDRLKKMQSDEGWEMAVKMREKDEVVWVLYRIEDEKIKELYVIVLDDEELVMVRAQGKLERLLARALRDSGGVKGLPRISDTAM
jgi:hypothetical protein